MADAGIILINLFAMDLIKPDIGLLFWMLLSFLIVLFLLKKFAWKPILGALKEREDSIKKSLNDADKARQTVANLKVDNEKLLMEARAERDEILKQARDVKKEIVAEAKEKAKEEASNIMKSARETIHNERMAAITELKNQVGILSIEIAEKVLAEELSSVDKQKKLIDRLLKDVNLN